MLWRFNKSVEEGEVDILVGTQIVTKGWILIE